MADLYFKIPQVTVVLDPDNVNMNDCTCRTVANVAYQIHGFNVGITEGLVRIIEPIAQVATDVRALASVTELTEAQYNTEKPNYPS